MDWRFLPIVEERGIIHSQSPVAIFFVPDCMGGDIVDSGIGLSYRPARLHKAFGPVRQPHARVDYIPSVMD